MSLDVRGLPNTNDGLFVDPFMETERQQAMQDEERECSDSGYRFQIESSDLGDDRAHVRLGNIYSRISDLTQEGERIPKALFKKIGGCPKDHTELSRLCRAAVCDKTRLLPSTDPGIFFVFTDTDNVDFKTQRKANEVLKQIRLGTVVPDGVFKVGRKRAQIEIAVRHMSHLFALQNHSIPGVFAAVKMPELPKEWDFDTNCLIEDLWNGDKKVFHPATKNGHVIGIFESFEPNSFKELSKEEKIQSFAELVTLGVIIGIRDGKKENIKNDKFIDVEECFPARLDPSPKQKIFKASINFPVVIDHEIAKERIPKQILISLYRKLDKVDLIKVLQGMDKQGISFRDIYFDEISSSTASPVPLDSEESVNFLEQASDTEELLFHDDQTDKLQTSESSDDDEVVFEDEESSTLDDTLRSTSDEEEVCIDGGNCSVICEPFAEEDEDLFPPNKTEKMFLPEQGNAFQLRVIRLKNIIGEAITKNIPLTCFDLVANVDTIFGEHSRLFEEGVFRSSSDVGRRSSTSNTPTTPRTFSVFNFSQPQPQPQPQPRRDPPVGIERSNSLPGDMTKLSISIPRLKDVTGK